MATGNSIASHTEVARRDSLLLTALDADTTISDQLKCVVQRLATVEIDSGIKDLAINDSVLERPVPRTKLALSQKVDNNTVILWMRIFGYNYPQAHYKIIQHRLRSDHICVYDTNSSTSELDDSDRDKESRDYSRRIETEGDLTHHRTRFLPPDAEFLVEVGKYDLTPRRVQKYLGLRHTPIEHKGRDRDKDGRTITFVLLYGRDVEFILKAVRTPEQAPNFMLISYADKTLCPTALYPSLEDPLVGRVHHRPNTELVVYPGQGVYPVWYFFYGELADEARLDGLRNVCNLKDSQQAEVVNETLARLIRSRNDTAGRPYPRIDRNFGTRQTATVAGRAIKIDSQEDEDLLRGFEERPHEIVKCSIKIVAETRSGWELKKGFTFRMVEDEWLQHNLGALGS